MLIAFEDKRFRSHHGVDPLAIGTRRLAARAPRSASCPAARPSPCRWRACCLASTSARCAGKIRQMLLRASAGAAAVQGRDPSALSAARAVRRQPGRRARRLARLFRQGAAAAVAGGSGPAGGHAAVARRLRRPDRFPEAARRARNRVLAACSGAGVIPPEEAARARASACRPRAASFRCWRRIWPTPGRAATRPHRPPPDARLPPPRPTSSSSCATRGNARAAASPPRSWCVDHRTGEVVVHVGSPGYLDGDRFGAVDMTTAVRSPGSTLKPIIYGLAFEPGSHTRDADRGPAGALRRLRAEELRQDWHGTVIDPHARSTQSLNIPAVKVLEALGAGRALRPLAAGRRRARAAQGQPSRRWPWRSGGLGLRLTDLASLYAASRAAASPSPSAYRRDRASRKARGRQPRLLSQVAAWYVADILCQALPPANAKPGQLCLQDRHLLRLPRRLGGGLRRPPRRGRVGGPARWRRYARPRRAHRRRAAAVRRLRPGRDSPHAARLRRRPACSCSPIPTCRRRSSASAKPVPTRAARPRRLSRARGQDRLPARPAELEIEEGDWHRWSSRPRAAPCR